MIAFAPSIGSTLGAGSLAGASATAPSASASASAPTSASALASPTPVPVPAPAEPSPSVSASAPTSVSAASVSTPTSSSTLSSTSVSGSLTDSVVASVTRLEVSDSNLHNPSSEQPCAAPPCECPAPSSEHPSSRAERTRRHNCARRAKKARVGEFVAWLVETFGARLTSVLDVAGGRGDLAFELCIERGIPATVVDPAPLRVSAFKTKRLFSLAARTFADTDPGATGDNLARVREWLDPEVCAVMEPYVGLAARVAVERGLVSLRVPLDMDFPAKFPRDWESAAAVIGLHPDQATEALVDLALAAGKPFATVPCCVFPDLFPREAADGSPVRSYDQFLAYLQAKDAGIRRAVLDAMPGCNVVLYHMGAGYASTN
eukprot:m.61549 g.61549  ORF g.61549 m.61549 type:complete len:375 (+) comp7091_c0_seq2:2390-3514(+)